MRISNRLNNIENRLRVLANKSPAGESDLESSIRVAYADLKKRCPELRKSLAKYRKGIEVCYCDQCPDARDPVDIDGLVQQELNRNRKSLLPSAL